MRQAGGAITVETELGRGTTFHIMLPVVKEGLTDLKSAVITIAPRGSETVLIAEDEAGVRDVAGAILSMQGYKVLVAETGVEAMKIASEYVDRSICC